jgi:ferredoxin
MLDLLRTILQTVFRLLPFPTRTGLRAIGQPGPDAPVLLTCNFDLTVRRVQRALAGVDCYLLVAHSKGINVWCAAGGGLLNAHSVISVLKTSRIADRVNHRTLILPQLSAPGIDVARVAQQTGWRCVFGPVYAKDLPDYLAAGLRKSDAMRRVRFPLSQRLEMAVMWAGPMSLVAGIPVAVFQPTSLAGVMGLIWAFALFLFAFYDPILRHVPGPASLMQTALLGAVGVAGVLAYGLLVGGWSTGALVGWSLGTLAVALMLGFDLDGSSPLYAGSTVAYWGRRFPAIYKLWEAIGYELEPPFTLSVDAPRCHGCGTCVEVCPRGVYTLIRQSDGLKSRIAHPERCEQCTACVKQCPHQAIMADPPLRGDKHEG